MGPLRVCVLQSSYEDSHSQMKEWDNFICTPAHSFKDPNIVFNYVKIKKAQAYDQIRKLASGGQFDIFLNLCDGGRDEDRAGIEVVQALEEFQVPFTGAVSRHYEPSKVEMKMLAYYEGIDIPAYSLLRKGDDLERALSTLNFPLIVKHPSGYSSIGLTKTSKCENPEDLRRETAKIIEEFGAALVEEFIEGREVTVLACEDGAGGDILVYDPIQVHFPPDEDFKHFGLKWVDFQGMEWKKLEEEDKTLDAQCKDIAAKAFKAILGGIGYGRSDLRIDQKTGKVYFLEINPNCGIFYPEGFYSSADYILNRHPEGVEGFTKRILQAALYRHQERQKMAPAWEIAFAKSQGFHLRANRNIQEGELVFPYEGTSFPLVSRHHVEKHWNPADKDLFARYAWPLSPQIFVIWNPEPSQWRPINHSCDPNLWTAENHGLDVYARRSIPCGEQLTLDYSTFCGGDYMKSFQCHCGSAGCRGLITGNDYQKHPSLRELFKTRVTDFIFNGKENIQ